MLEPGLFIVPFEFSLIQALDREPLVCMRWRTRMSPVIASSKID